MRICILTFHRAQNYGAVLQAYALQKKIEELLLKFGLLSVDLFEGEGVDDKKEIRDWCMYHIKL